MCGIAGLWAFGGGSEEELSAAARAMADALRHRGPDDEGVWCDAHAGVALGFRRLAILDLTPAGAQPMRSASGRYTIAFNGEVYNFRELAARLEAEGRAPAFRGHSDTEVLLACIEAWGLDEAVSRFVGMFAFALWDAGERELSLVRDRAGVKPLYYELSTRRLAFASELKALQVTAGSREIDREALGLYTALGYVPAPHAIYRGVRKLLPGSILTLGEEGTTRERRYWDPRSVAESAAARRFQGSESDAIDEAERLLAESVRLRLIADVPLGLFLSSGVDSSLVAAMMRHEADDVATFTIGFEGRDDEAPRAAAIARHLGTRHTEEYIRPEQVIAMVPQIAATYDEPFGDSSALPTLLVSQLARRSVTVALSGDGGDELFGGYHTYFLGERLQKRVSRVPRTLRRPLGRALRGASRLPWRANLSDRLHGFGSALVLDDPMAKYEGDRHSRSLPVVGAALPSHDRAAWPALADPVELMMYLDFTGYLADDILVKVDRASMATSLEAREPLLDHRLIEFAWSLPLSMKLREGRGKWILRQVLARHLPADLIEGGKRGFGLPLEEWLAGPLRGWASSLIDRSRIRQEGWFAPAAVARLWAGNRPAHRSVGALWRLLMFQQWLASSRR
jgi:asparagine synthase (glutamine-hydrolysing)